MIIWIASYPKSGNTYIRSFLSAYYFSKDGEFEFDLLKNIKQFPDNFFFDKELNNIEEAFKNYVPAQKKIFENKKATFLKSHNLLGLYKGHPFTIPEYTLGAIYVVRDPRNVIVSLMNHYSLSEKEALEFFEIVASKPMPLSSLLDLIISSRPAKAPPHMKRIFEVST